MQDVLNSSAFHGWQTPQSFLELVRAVAPISLDPCTAPNNPTRADVWLTGQLKHMINPPRVIDDGLALPWATIGGLAFINPPYGRSLPAWSRKIVAEAELGTQQVVLVPCRPDTAWYATLAGAASMRLEWRGRITFVDPRAPAGMQWDAKRECFVKAQPAAFPVAVFYFAGETGSSLRFMTAFDGRGRFCQDIRQSA